MAKKKQGHYCKICGEYKANEKFSGKGHAAHICIACSKLSAAEKAERQTFNRLLNFNMGRLSASEKSWLENRVHDRRPEVAELARGVYNAHFPFAERNARKKQLYILHLDFEVHTEVFDEYGDEYLINRRFTADRHSHILTMADLDTGTEQAITLEAKRMNTLLKWIVHSLEIFMWAEDYGLLPEDSGFEEDSFEEGFEEMDIPEEPPTGPPSWRVQVDYTDHTAQESVSYQGYLPHQPEELYFALMEYFEPVADDYEDESLSF